MYHIEHPTENSLLVRFSTEIDIDTTIRISRHAEHIRSEISHLLEVIPSFCSLLIEYDFLKTDPQLLEKNVRNIIEHTETRLEPAKSIILPCYYDASAAPDLQELADEKQLSIAEIIEIHSSTEYTVCSTGFAPGFAYLAEVDPRLTSPRHTTPRASIPAGSVGIADSQTAVYPSASPAGWKIIGNCPRTLFDLASTPMSIFTIGDKVRFKPISKSDFLEMGGQLG